MNTFMCFGKSRRREAVKTVDGEGGVELSFIHSFLLINHNFILLAAESDLSCFSNAALILTKPDNNIPGTYKHTEKANNV